MAKVIVHEDTCKGCELCITACPRSVLALDPHKLNSKGYHFISVVKPEACTACAMCARMCPDCALEIEK